jgi:hypothetical protein
MYHTTRKRRSALEKTREAVLEALEIRQLLSVVSVSTNAQLQSAIANAQAGQTIQLAAGTYNGFQLSASGTSGAPIVIEGTKGTIISGTPGDSNGFIDIAGCSYVTIDNLDIECDNSTAARAGIWAGGEAGDNVQGLTVENTTINNADWWGMLWGFVNNSSILDNTFNGTMVQHTCYIGNSSNDVTVEGNTFENAYACGLEINEDQTQGGPGYGGGFVINGNTFINDAAGAGASINFDGVQNSTIENNLIYNGQRNGIALYQINGADPSTGNTIVNNTIDVNSNSDAGYAAISLIDGAANTTIMNNILSSAENTINVDSASQVGLVSDYNIFSSALIDPTGNGDYTSTSEGGTAISLSQWQAMGFDKHSTEVSNIAGLFVNASSGNYQLASGSAAIGAGTSTDAPVTDMLGNGRPTGGAYDVGAYQYDGTASSGSGSGSSGSGSSGSGSSGSGSSGSGSSGSSSSGSSSSGSSSSGSSSSGSSSSGSSSSGSSSSGSSSSGSSSSGSSSSGSSSSGSSSSGSSSSGSKSSGSSSSGSSSSGSSSSNSGSSSSGSGSGGGTDSSTPPMAGPAAPTDLQAMTKWTGPVVLRWTDTGTNVTQYEIESSGDGVTFNVIGTTDSSQLMYTDATATAGTPIYYQIVAVDALGDTSAGSNIVMVTPLSGGDPDESKFSTEVWTSSSGSGDVSASVRPSLASASNTGSSTTGNTTTADSTPVASDSSSYNGPNKKWWLTDRRLGQGFEICT